MAIYADDRKLARRLLAGDERAFNRFFDDNFARLYRFVSARLPDDPASAEDIVQSALTRALRHIGKYRGEAALFTWLCVICRNELAEWARRNSRYHERVFLTEDFREIREVVESMDAATENPAFGDQQRLETTRLIQVALDRLPASYGNALEWKYIHGYSVREVALRLGVSQVAAQSLLARARQAFKEIYLTLAEPVLQATEAPNT